MPLLERLTRQDAPRWQASPDPRRHRQQRHLPNLPLITHEGRTVRFYDDLVRNRRAVINVSYTVCSNICSPVTRNLMEARALLGDAGRDIRFYSLSLTPLDDHPAALRAYMERFGIEGGWTFLTGAVPHVERVRQALGLSPQDPAEEANLDNHSSLVRLIDEPRLVWGHASGLSSGRSIARMIRFAFA
jgi:protein SCO1/2